jgi:hypothetical protein
MRKLILAFALIVLLLGAAFAALPWLIVPLSAPRIAAALALESVEFEVGYPGLTNIVFSNVVLVGPGLEIRATGVHLSYGFELLRTRRVNSVDVEHLEVTVERVDPGSGSETGETGEAKQRTDRVLPLIPSDRIQVSDIRLHIPVLDFLAAGRGFVDDDVVELRLTGVAPEFARDLDAGLKLESGHVRLTLQDQDAAAPSSVLIEGTLGERALPLSSEFRITGAVLGMMQQFLDLPAGTGALSGKASTVLPWPLTAVPDWRTLEGSGVARLDWRHPAWGLTVDGSVAEFEIAGGSLNTLVSADLLLEIEDTRVEASILEGKFLVDESGVRSSDPQSRMSFRSGDILGALTLHSIQYESGQPGLVELAAALEMGLDAVSLDGELTALANLAPRPDGRLRFEGQVDAWPVVLSGDYSYGEGAFEADGRIRTGPVADLPFSLAHDTGANRGSLILQERIDFSEPVLAATVPAFSEPFDFDEGTLEFDGAIRWSGDAPIRAALNLGLDDVGAHYDEMVATGLAGQINLEVTPDGWQLGSSNLISDVVDVGFPITGLEARFSGDGRRIVVEALAGALLGGTASSEPFPYVLDTREATVQLRLADIDLARLLALEGEDITGSGRLAGHLPIRLTGSQVAIHEGRVWAEGPGTIRLSPSLTSAFTQPGMDIALKSLENFFYEKLESSVEYDAGGDLQLGLRLEGRNPDIEEGRPIHYNLNISENIPVLLRSLRLTDAVGRSVEKRVLR